MEQADLSTAMIDEGTDAEKVSQWLQKFESALCRHDRDDLAALFAEDSHWRDLLAFTWNITPCQGNEAIAYSLITRQPKVRACGFQLAPGRTPPRRLKRLGVDVIEAIFAFETQTGRANGVIRLPLNQPARAWVIMTSLQELKGHEPPINERRPTGTDHSGGFAGENWAERRAREQAFSDREPAVLIVGAGQSGLSTAARLRLLGVDTLCVDKMPRVGDVWRERYHSLALHNKVPLNHMAYLPFPPHWPAYLPKDMIGHWLEHYAISMECNVWSGTSFLGADFDEGGDHWNARVQRADGSERVLRPRHIIFANGILGAPKSPKLPGLEDFKGKVFHTHGFRNGADWQGKNALVLGAGTSGHDIAQDLCNHGANVKMIQRGSITVSSVEAANLSHALYYDEGLPIEDCDLIATSNSYPLAIRAARMLTERQQDMDKTLLSGLAARGFKLDVGEDGTGYLMKVRRQHAGYYLNIGASNLVVEGKIGLLQYADIERFVPEGALMKDGRLEKADLLVTATGYQSPLEVVRQLLGSQIADKIGPIWGIAADGELNNMYRPTPQKGLWFVGSGFSQARIYSHFIALQIRARESGLVA
ncbi:NAD(P)/FAD-dependent oxidoreductase [Variovorax guangxiensis]|uniref:flavin-containing monooxygenase n=1 Tax=Variovorax guangxiensis TaxID=1775474 RepID=UPI002863CA87|nr:NAD(P)/FAD-dependent oxidoreductase [Variovorax guangxiensis]MDR6861538.1 putative flavoprotein involved in K+ transport [Variovorax guangxiensis]